MKLLSFDVGIKNLAYCLIEVNDDKKFTILKWGIIDLLNRPVYTCCAKQRKKPHTICGKSASYKDPEQKQYCKQHAKSTEYIILPKDLGDTHIKRAKVSELKLLADKYEIKYDTPILKKTLVEKLNDFKKIKCLTPIKEEKVDSSLVGMSISMTHIFDDLFKNDNIECVLIENQISKIASTMKTIQGMITQYFVMIKVEDIHYISSYNKLKLFVPSKKNLTYKERKNLGIECTLKELDKSQTQEWINYFNTHKKKDDLADSFLQGFWYINMKLRTT